MKNERILKGISIAVIVLLIISIVNIVSAFTAGMTLTSASYLKAGEQVKVSVKLNNLDVGNGIDAMLATLEYDTNVFEPVATANFAGSNEWKINVFNANTKKFTITRNEKSKDQGEILTITFTAKQSINVDSTKITLKDITASGGDVTMGGTGDIEISNASVTISKKVEQNNVVNNAVNNTANNIANTIKNVVNNVTNVVKNNTAANNNTVAKLPQTGENTVFVVVGMIAVVILGTVFYIRYNNIKNV